MQAESFAKKLFRVSYSFIRSSPPCEDKTSAVKLTSILVVATGESENNSP
jgi:hypothetical protein